MLTVSSYPTRTSVVLRGKYLLENILNAPPPPPPAGCARRSTRRRSASRNRIAAQLEQHRADPLCASCHSKMDPLGFALENYDAIGRWRTRGRQVPGGFHRRTSQRQNVLGAGGNEGTAASSACRSSRRGLAEKNADICPRPRGRALRPARGSQDLVRQAAAQDTACRRLIQAIVTSVPFQQRRGRRARRAWARQG